MNGEESSGLLQGTGTPSRFDARRTCTRAALRDYGRSKYEYPLEIPARLEVFKWVRGELLRGA